jgi:hypothetical protein
VHDVAKVCFDTDAADDICCSGYHSYVLYGLLPAYSEPCLS